jgi:7-keto-8-aminopelargonate synthetase-like enzyme
VSYFFAPPVKALALAEPLEQIDRVWVRYRGRKLLYFGGCDYYRLASDPVIARCAVRAIEKEGLLNVAASRVTTGNHPVYEQLEAALAIFFRVPAALLTSTGYAADLVIAQALAGQFSHAVIDERVHSSLKDAARFLDCPVLEYKHRDARHAAQTMVRCGPHAKIILLTDGVFAHDGTLAPLRELLKALPPDAVLLLDDAHGAGVLGKNGRGTVEHFRIQDKRIVRAITLSKAFGAYGGAVLGNRKLYGRIVERSDLFAGSTPPPLPMAVAAVAALATVAGSDSLRARLRRNLKLIGKDVPILTLAPRTAPEADRLKRRLLAAGIFPSFIRYPGGPLNGYFRFAISSEHTADQIKRLLDAIRAPQ